MVFHVLHDQLMFACRLISNIFGLCFQKQQRKCYGGEKSPKCATTLSIKGKLAPKTNSIDRSLTSCQASRLFQNVLSILGASLPLVSRLPSSTSHRVFSSRSLCNIFYVPIILRILYFPWKRGVYPKKTSYSRAVD